MTRILILLALFIAACSSNSDNPERLASIVQADCVGPPGYQASGLLLAPSGVQRAHFLINKMWGTWPKPPTVACNGGYCHPVPATCTQAECDAGQCYGWTCQMTGYYYAEDGLRFSTMVKGPAYVENRWALQPDVDGLTGLETTELGVARLAATVLTDFWCEL